MIKLTKDHLIAKGNERECYMHPNDPSKIIKIPYKIHRNQNELEFNYLDFLEKLKVPFTHIAKCFGYIDTNLGKGLVFERVLESNYRGGGGRTSW